jgi:Protein of unknown function (DUF1353)
MASKEARLAPEPAPPKARIFCSYDTQLPEVWRLETAYSRATSMGTITVPVGFVWDGASVPKRFWDLLPPWGAYSGAALIHDYLCDMRPPGISSDEAHRVFYELMLEDGVPKRESWIMYKSVLRFGPQWEAST